MVVEVDNYDVFGITSEEEEAHKNHFLFVATGNNRFLDIEYCPKFLSGNNEM